MKVDQVRNQLDKMLADPKAKGFLNHLLKSYLPVSKVSKVIDKPRGEFKCCLTREQLYSFEDILVGISDEVFMKDFTNFVSHLFDEKTDKTSPIANVVKERKLGVVGTETNSFMSYEAYQEFIGWVTEKVFAGDKHIHWMMTQIRKNDKSIGDLFPSREPKVSIPAAKAATFTLGELDFFKDLKAKFQD